MGQTNSIELRVNLRKNNNEKSDQFGKLYAELETNKTLSLRGLAKHIADHNSIYGRDVIVGVLTKLSECVIELVAMGQPVKLDGLGTFYPTAKNVKGGIATLADAKAMAPAAQVEGIHVRFDPEGSQLDDITSKKMKERCSLVWGNLIEITGTVPSATGKTEKPVYKLTPISNPIVNADPEPDPEP